MLKFKIKLLTFFKNKNLFVTFQTKIVKYMNGNCSVLYKSSQLREEAVDWQTMKKPIGIVWVC